jgi:hypothetical protein
LYRINENYSAPVVRGRAKPNAPLPDDPVVVQRALQILGSRTKSTTEKKKQFLKLKRERRLKLDRLPPCQVASKSLPNVSRCMNSPNSALGAMSDSDCESSSFSQSSSSNEEEWVEPATSTGKKRPKTKCWSNTQLADLVASVFGNPTKASSPTKDHEEHYQAPFPNEGPLTPPLSTTPARLAVPPPSPVQLDTLQRSSTSVNGQWNLPTPPLSANAVQFLREHVPSNTVDPNLLSLSTTNQDLEIEKWSQLDFGNMNLSGFFEKPPTLAPFASLLPWEDLADATSNESWTPYNSYSNTSRDQSMLAAAAGTEATCPSSIPGGVNSSQAPPASIYPISTRSLAHMAMDPPTTGIFSNSNLPLRNSHSYSLGDETQNHSSITPSNFLSIELSKQPNKIVASENGLPLESVPPNIFGSCSHRDDFELQTALGMLHSNVEDVPLTLDAILNQDPLRPS